MLRKIILAGAALATLSVPVAADAQHYRTYGTYSGGRHYYWDGHHYRDRSSNAIIDALLGGVIGYALGATTSRSYGYPSYGYSNYGYSNYGYSYPSYGYSTYGYSYPSYGYSTYGYSYPSYGYSYPTYRNRCYNYGYRC